MPHWHALSRPACLRELDSTPRGLGEAERARRLERIGGNRLALDDGRPLIRILLAQFGNVMLLMLLATAAGSATLAALEHSFPRDAVAILAIVLLDAFLGFLQESRAQRTLQALQRLGEPLVTVRCGRRWCSLPADQLVPGDVILLKAGDLVPADGRLLAASGLGVQEAALTGESETVAKHAAGPLPPATAVLERRNCVFQGTQVLTGRAAALVTATGMATELGRIAGLVRDAGGQATPLQTRLAGLARTLVLGALIAVALVVTLGWWRGLPPVQLLTVALSMAVAVLPEGLPAVITVALAIATQRMVRRGALMRHLPAVETLGSVTVICTDKTGTLTLNRQVVEELRCGTEALHVVDGGDAPIGPFRHHPLAAPAGVEAGCTPAALNLLLAAGVLCGDATRSQGPDGSWQVRGDPTEVALVEVAAQADGALPFLHGHHPRRSATSFSAERRRMAVLVSDPQGLLQVPLGDTARGATSLWLSKGAPEVILEACDQWLTAGGVTALRPPQRQWWLDQVRTLAGGGLRVLAFACAPERHPASAAPGPMILLGLMGQRDPARPEVAEAVRRCRQAGIRPVMITGDHPLTARAIAEETGVVAAGAPLVLGERLSGSSDADLEELVRHTSLYARVPPEQKLRLVRALQRNGEVVAMTGDGVNDAPALRQADIGVAMGLVGTEVSRQAADVVLLDDNFATIVHAVEEGRLVYENIRRFVRYVLGGNLGELIVYAVAPLLGLTGVAQTPLQILWINLVTDGLPALALVLEPASADLMAVEPIRRGESIFARGIGATILRTGLVFAMLTVALMHWAAGTGRPWQTMTFTTLCLAQMAHALSARSEQPLIRVPLLANPTLLGSIGISCLLQLALLYIPDLAAILGLQPLTSGELAICAGVSLVFLLALEGDKALRRRLAGPPPPSFQAQPGHN